MHRNRLISAAVALGFIVGVSSISAVSAAAPRCHGQKATIVGKGKVTGTAKRDVIVLTAASKVKAGAGNDVICGSRGNDVIDAGAGNDEVYGGAGNDILIGGPGTDMLMGEAGMDTVDGVMESMPTPTPTPTDSPTPTPSPTATDTASPTPTPTPTPTTTNPADVVLTISGFSFAKVSVKAGSTVTIRNTDGVDHTVTIAAQGIDVAIAAGETSSFIAPKVAGNYVLTCDLHPAMKGTLVVTN